MADAPPQPLRWQYYVLEVRLPPKFLAWAERDIASTAWLVRECGRLVAAFIVLSAIFNRFRVNARTVAALLVGICAIVAMKEFLRKIALAYQRYGNEWDGSSKAPPQFLRVGLAVVFSAVFVLLTR